MVTRRGEPKGNPRASKIRGSSDGGASMAKKRRYKREPKGAAWMTKRADPKGNPQVPKRRPEGEPIGTQQKEVQQW